MPQEEQLARQEYIAALYAAFIAAHGFRADLPLIIVCELMPDSVMKNLTNIPGLRVRVCCTAIRSEPPVPF